MPRRFFRARRGAVPLGCPRTPRLQRKTKRAADPSDGGGKQKRRANPGLLGRLLPGIVCMAKSFASFFSTDDKVIHRVQELEDQIVQLQRVVAELQSSSSPALERPEASASNADHLVSSVVPSSQLPQDFSPAASFACTIPIVPPSPPPSACPGPAVPPASSPTVPVAPPASSQSVKESALPFSAEDLQAVSLRPVENDEVSNNKGTQASADSSAIKRGFGSSCSGVPSLQDLQSVKLRSSTAERSETTTFSFVRKAPAIAPPKRNSRKRSAGDEDDSSSSALLRKAMLKTRRMVASPCSTRSPLRAAPAVAPPQAPVVVSAVAPAALAGSITTAGSRCSARPFSAADLQAVALKPVALDRKARASRKRLAQDGEEEDDRSLFSQLQQQVLKKCRLVKSSSVLQLVESSSPAAVDDSEWQ